MRHESIFNFDLVRLINHTLLNISITHLLRQTLHFHLEWDLVLSLHDLGEADKFVNELLPHHLLDDVLVIVISQRSAELVVVHVVLVFPHAPHASHFLRIEEFELAVVICPLDDVLMLITQQKLQQKLPQCNIRLHT